MKALLLPLIFVDFETGCDGPNLVAGHSIIPNACATIVVPCVTSRPAAELRETNPVLILT
jgi:hypothetical protein